MGKMKNFGTSETMQKLMLKSVCALLSLLLLLSAVLPVKAAAETAPAKVVRVGSFEDTFNYVNEKGARKGYGYELLETLSGYTGWQFEYVTCDWSDCFEKLENGEIDIMSGISYTEDRTEEMLFSDEPMGVEKYYLYADLSRADISASDFKTLNGKKIGGILCESVCYGYQQQGRGILCGIGINLAQPQSYFDAANLPNGTSLALQGANVDLAADPAWLAEGLTDFGFDRNLYTFARDGFAPFREEYKAACVNLGRRVTFDLPEGGQGAGEAIDVDEEGRLVVRTDSGEVHVFTGEVSVHGIYGAV